uniref:LRRNT domain-containing protein n=1 Tax=Callorhinchus milii TaxID=7868 RepID=A0A4W3K4C9_CALMI
MCFCDSRPLRLLSVLLVGIALTGANCPSECNCLEHEVSCQSKNLKNFPQSLPFHIRYLDISRNQIKYLPLIELSYLTDLVYLNCSYNIIEKISRLPFLNVVKLISLDLSHNHLTTISQMTFQTLKSLTMLCSGVGLESTVF